jgi:hypothetical protein
MDGSRDACAAVIAGPCVGEYLSSHHGRPERVVEFAIREHVFIFRRRAGLCILHRRGSGGAVEAASSAFRARTRMSGLSCARRGNDVTHR